MMKYTLIIDSINWDDDYNNSAITCIKYSVFKKGFMGGLKPVQKNWCLVCKTDLDGTIDINQISIQDDNIQTQPFDPQLAWAVLNSAKDAMSKAGNKDKEALLLQVSQRFFRKHFLGEETETVQEARPTSKMQKSEIDKLDLLDTFFREATEYIQFLNSGKEMMIANDDTIAMLRQEEGKFYYQLSIIEGKGFCAEYVRPFRATEKNIKIFNEGCAEIARRLRIYLETRDPSKIPHSPPAFMELSDDWKEPIEDAGLTDSNYEISLRELLKRDFGIDFPITSGTGSSIDDPIVFASGISKENVGIEYSIIDCICQSRSVAWETLGQELLSYEGKDIDKVNIQTKKSTETGLITQSENFYFCFHRPEEWTLVCEFGDSKTYVDRSSVHVIVDFPEPIVGANVLYLLDPPGQDKQSGKLISKMQMNEEYDLIPGRFRVHGIIFSYTDGTSSSPLTVAAEWAIASGGNLNTLKYLHSLMDW